LLRKKVVQDCTCELCGEEPETASHLILHCAFAASLWRSLGVVIPADFSVHDLRKLPRPATIEAVHYETFTLNEEIALSSGKKQRRYDRPCKPARPRLGRGAVVYHVMPEV